MQTDTFIALLLLSTFTTVGIVTVLAARSRRHWFLRVAVVVAILSPLLVVPAPELFITLLLEAATIAVGIATVQFARRRAIHVRFSLRTLVLVTVLVAGLLAVGRATPELNRYAWQSLVLIGVGGGLCVLLGLAAAAKRPRWYLRLPAIVLASLLIGLVLGWFDWFVSSLEFWCEWPPEPRSLPYQFFSTTIRTNYDSSYPIRSWLVVGPAISIGTAVWLLLARAAGFVPMAYDDDTYSRRASYAARALSVIGFAVVGILPAAVLLRLLTPGDVPMQQLPVPNAYDTIVDVVGTVEVSRFKARDWDWDTVPATTLAPAIGAIENDLEMLHEVLTKPSQVPLQYSRDDIDRSIMGDERLLARALMARARLARLDGKPEGAFEPSLDAVRLGYSTRRGGLVTHALIGIAISSMGCYDLYDHRESLSVEQCRRASDALIALDAEVEDFHHLIERERLWSRIVMGWHLRLQQIDFEVALIPVSAETSYGGAFARDRVVVRLLALELALRAYHLDQHEYPTSLAELVPDYIDHLPSDPCDLSGAPLRYSRTDDGYLLYSVGGNHRDDGGAPPGDGEFAILGAYSAGDLRLDVHFDDGTSPSSAAKAPTAADAEDAADVSNSDAE